MCGRVVVPVYDDSGKFMVAYTGRSIYTKCAKCLAYHAPQDKCIIDDYVHLHSKWKNQADNPISQYLYNYWNAKKYIVESKTVILVEGPGDVWKLEEAGIHNSVAIFGLELYDSQQIILESSGAMTAVLLLDNDEPGRNATIKLKEQLRRCYKIVVPSLPAKDIGEISISDIQKLKGVFCQ